MDTFARVDDMLGTTPRSSFDVPARYVDGYSMARTLDPDLAERYIRHTTLADPLADQAVEQLARAVAPQHVHSVIARTIGRHCDLPSDTPEALRELIDSSAFVPDWFDPETAMTATRAFLRNSDIVLGGSWAVPSSRAFPP